MEDECLGVKEIEGWKGKSGTELVGQGENYFIIREWRKNKETGEYYEDDHKVYLRDIDVLWNIIDKNCGSGETYGSRYFWRKLIQEHNIAEAEDMTEEQMINAFNGGKFRKKYYFRYFYYPAKYLEIVGKISYFGRGGLMKC